MQKLVPEVGIPQLSQQWFEGVLLQQCSSHSETLLQYTATRSNINVPFSSLCSTSDQNPSRFSNGSFKFVSYVVGLRCFIYRFVCVCVPEEIRRGCQILRTGGIRQFQTGGRCRQQQTPDVRSGKQTQVLWKQHEHLTAELSFQPFILSDQVLFYSSAWPQTHRNLTTASQMLGFQV